MKSNGCYEYDINNNCEYSYDSNNNNNKNGSSNIIKKKE